MPKSIYLVLQHDKAKKHLGRMSEHDALMKSAIIYHPPDSDTGHFGHNHGIYCSCLIIKRKTYRTRKEADDAADQFQKADPDSVYWSLEVYEPE